MSLESFRAARWIRTINLVLQAFLFLSLFAGLNYIALHYSLRFDLTRSRSHSLSAETIAYLHGLERPIDITVAMDENSDNDEFVQASRDIHALLKEYVYVTRTNSAGKVNVDYIDAFQKVKEAKLLNLEQNTILLRCGEQRHVISVLDLYRFEKGETKAFQGEATLTSAILDVQNPDKKKIYFVIGHSEMRTDDVDAIRGLSQLGDQLRQRNFQVAALDLAASKAVPNDAALVVIPSPQVRFSGPEQENLRQYLSLRAGRIILMMDPGRPHGLENLLADWGLRADDDLIYDTSSDYSSETGDLLISSFTQHPVTQLLIDYAGRISIGPSRSLRLDPSRPKDAGLNISFLASTGPSAWGKLDFGHGPPDYLQGVDVPGPLNVMAASQSISADKLPESVRRTFSVKDGRLLVIGTAGLVTNNRITNLGNLNLFLSAVNWSIDRDVQLNVPARPIQKYQLSLSDEELKRLRIGLLFVLPGLPLLLLLIVYWTRRA